MMITPLLVVTVAVLMWLVAKERLLSNVHVTTVIIEKPYTEVWHWISDPLTYPTIYPKWVTKIEHQEGGKYFVTSPHVEKPYAISVMADERNGHVDIQIGQERSRTRIFELDEKSTVVIHFGAKWEEFSQLLWVIYKFNVDSDFKNAKSVIESEKKRGIAAP